MTSPRAPCPRASLPPKPSRPPRHPTAPAKELAGLAGAEELDAVGGPVLTEGRGRRGRAWPRRARATSGQPAADPGSAASQATGDRPATSAVPTAASWQPVSAVCHRGSLSSGSPRCGSTRWYADQRATRPLPVRRSPGCRAAAGRGVRSSGASPPTAISRPTSTAPPTPVFRAGALRRRRTARAGSSRIYETNGAFVGPASGPLPDDRSRWVPRPRSATTGSISARGPGSSFARDRERNCDRVSELTFSSSNTGTVAPSGLGRWWDARGVSLRRVRAHAPRPCPIGQWPYPTELGDADALVVPRREAGANDDADYPWLPATRALIATTVAAGRPFLGICLGHQLAAAALGDDRANPGGHATGLTLTDAGRSRSFARTPSTVRARFQWNNDIALELPADAVVLATAPDGSLASGALRAPTAYGVSSIPDLAEQFDSWTIFKKAFRPHWHSAMASTWRRLRGPCMPRAASCERPGNRSPTVLSTSSAPTVPNRRSTRLRPCYAPRTDGVPDVVEMGPALRGPKERGPRSAWANVSGGLVTWRVGQRPEPAGTPTARGCSGRARLPDLGRREPARRRAQPPGFDPTRDSATLLLAGGTPHRWVAATTAAVTGLLVLVVAWSPAAPARVRPCCSRWRVPPSPSLALVPRGSDVGWAGPGWSPPSAR